MQLCGPAARSRATAQCQRKLLGQLAAGCNVSAAVCLTSASPSQVSHLSILCTLGISKAQALTSKLVHSGAEKRLARMAEAASGSQVRQERLLSLELRLGTASSSLQTGSPYLIQRRQAKLEASSRSDQRKSMSLSPWSGVPVAVVITIGDRGHGRS